MQGSFAAPDERRRAGIARRDTVPLAAHAEVVTEGRGDPIAILTAQDAERLASLVPIRHGRMLPSAFTFYRGAAAIMAADLARTPTTDLRVQLCGDAHLANFGVFNAPDRRLVFDVNDFDETLPGPFEWDVKRLAASMVVAARTNGVGTGKAREAARRAVAEYRELISWSAQRGPLELFYHRLDVDTLMRRLADVATKADRKRLARELRKAEGKTSLRALRKLTDVVDGRRVIVPDPPRVVPLDQFADHGSAPEEIPALYDAYLDSLPDDRRALLRRYGVVDIAVKVVGVGSVGTRCLIVLLESGGGEPLFLQFKEAAASVLGPYAGPSDVSLHGERVVLGQRRMQAAGDLFLGWARDDRPGGGEVDFYFRQLWDGKGSAVIAGLGGRRLAEYGAACGAALALAHARTGDAAMIDGYLGDDDTFDQALTAFAERYADLTEEDHRAHVRAVDEGRIEARTGV
jgi:uncharacterized protein (DUF2252 family)